MVEPEVLEVAHPAWALALKRAFDLAAALCALLLLAPVFAAVALAVKCTSPGPVLYRGVRAGRGGTTFRIFKFRTMVRDAESLGGPTTGTGDSRVTRVGALLRKTKLDELPQLLNVVAGQMSLVGPRPEVLEYTSRYEGDERCILSMRPGITDFASVEFADLDDIVGCEDPDRYFRERVLPRKNALRVRYVKEWSLASDFGILLKTVLRVLRRVVHR